MEGLARSWKYTARRRPFTERGYQDVQCLAEGPHVGILTHEVRTLSIASLLNAVKPHCACVQGKSEPWFLSDRVGIVCGVACRRCHGAQHIPGHCVATHLVAMDTHRLSLWSPLLRKDRLPPCHWLDRKSAGRWSVP